MLHILFVCTGNTCRSPMAEAIFAKKSEDYGIKSIISSAGIGFVGESGVSKNAVTVCNEIDIDISGHKPRIIRERDLEVADIFVAMTDAHAETLKAIGVEDKKIYVLGNGIPDPYGSDLVTYRRCRRDIEQATVELCEYIKRNYPQCVGGIPSE